MIMKAGTGTISNYGNYISNCTKKQFPYQIPVNSLSDVQLFISIGSTKPAAAEYQLINTCGIDKGTIESITPANYVIGQDDQGSWYGVFKNFSASTAKCFVIAITLDSQIYFSEEYCIENCLQLTLLKGCYGNLDPALSHDCNGVYFGYAGLGDSLGDTTIKYEHQIYLRQVEVSLSAINNTFKQGLTRNFRTEKQKIYQFYGEFLPEWYLSEIDAIFYRGEVYIGSDKYLLDATAYEKIEDCKRIWKPTATFKDSCYQSFTCESDPCSPPNTECCDPAIISTQVTEVLYESGITDSGGTGGGSSSQIVVVQSIVDGTPNVTGTFDSVTGIVDGSLVITCDAFANKRVYVERGNVFNPGIDPGDGSQWHGKILADNFITFSSALVSGEFIYIETIA